MHAAPTIFFVYVESRGPFVMKLAGIIKRIVPMWCANFGIILFRVIILYKNLTCVVTDYPNVVNRKIEALSKTFNI